MSVRAVSWVLHESQSTGNDRLVLIVIADEADSEGLDAFPSIDRISRLARVARRTVIRSLERLEGAGELLIRRPDHPGRGRFNRYTLTLGRPPGAVAASIGWPAPRLDPAVAADWASECHSDTLSDPGDNPPEKVRKGATGDRFGCQAVTPDPKTLIDARGYRPRRRGLDPRADPVETTQRAAAALQNQGNAQVVAGRSILRSDPAAAAELIEHLRASLGEGAKVVHVTLAGDGSAIPTPNAADFGDELEE